MRKIAVFNQKGGVGKTTTAINLAAGLSRNGKKVCLIDLDPQGSVSFWHNLEGKKNLYHIITENEDLDNCITKLAKNLDVIHCDGRLADAESFMFEQDNNRTILEQRFTPGLNYDYVILDCPPSLRLMNQNALFYAREVMIPTSADIMGMDALRKTLKKISEFNTESSQKLMVSAIVPTLFDKRNKVCKNSLKEMQKEFTSLLVTNPVRMNSKLKEAPKARKSIFNYARKSPGAEDYWKLVKLTLENEYMYDSRIKPEKREEALKEYFEHGKKREMAIVNNKVTFTFTFATQAGNGKDVDRGHVAQRIIKGEYA